MRRKLTNANINSMFQMQLCINKFILTVINGDSARIKRLERMVEGLADEVYDDDVAERISGTDFLNNNKRFDI